MKTIIYTTLGFLLAALIIVGTFYIFDIIDKSNELENIKQLSSKIIKIPDKIKNIDFSTLSTLEKEELRKNCQDAWAIEKFWTLMRDNDKSKYFEIFFYEDECKKHF